MISIHKSHDYNRITRYNITIVHTCILSLLHVLKVAAYLAKSDAKM